MKQLDIRCTARIPQGPPSDQCDEKTPRRPHFLLLLPRKMDAFLDLGTLADIPTERMTFVKLSQDSSCNQPLANLESVSLQEK
jgi:hypothetical protein